MGFTDDIWTALLSDDLAEVEEAVDRIGDDEVASAIASKTLVTRVSLDSREREHSSRGQLTGGGEAAGSAGSDGNMLGGP